MNRRIKSSVAAKLCVRCGEVKPLHDFYSNKEWATQSFHDAWCKACALGFCKDRETLQSFCWYNNRSWSDDYYETA